jgi:RNA polymerase-binding transcription factor DksA
MSFVTVLVLFNAVAFSASDADRARDETNAASRKRAMEDLERKVSRNDAAARRAIGTMCSGCGGPANATARRSVQPNASRPVRPLRPENAPDYEWVPPVDDPE